MRRSLLFLASSLLLAACQAPPQSALHADDAAVGWATSALLELRISSASSAASAISSYNNSFIGRGITPAKAIFWAYGTPSCRTIMDPALTRRRYDFTAKVPNGQDLMLAPLVQQGIKAVFNVDIHRGRLDRDVFIASVAKNAKSGLQPSTQTAGRKVDYISSSNNSIKVKCTHAELGKLFSALEGPLDRPIVDETGLKGEFAIEFKYEGRLEEASILKALQEQLGLKLARGRRSVEMLSAKKLPGKAG
ncbi:MAG: TIGR03435 family protein [Elusimicrobia bacterium]|nr:TIGR03435 family protein [Elusimicrobiota bacterium]